MMTCFTPERSKFLGSRKLAPATKQVGLNVAEGCNVLTSHLAVSSLDSA